MSKSTRRRWCMIGFAAFCVFPTSIVVAFCASRHMPGRIATEAATLGKTLGLVVTINDFAYLRPGAIRYEKLRLADPETGETLVECPTVEASWQSVRDDRGQSRPVVVLRAPKAQVAAAGFDRLWRLPRRLLHAGSGASECDVRLAINEVVLEGTDSSHTLTEVDLSLETLASGSVAQAVFRVRGVEASERSRVRVVRNRQVNPPSTAVDLDTRGAVLPCSLLAIGLPPMRGLGASAGFRGYLWTGIESPSGDLTGQLVNVDLERLIDGSLPYRCSGRAEIAIQTARFRDGRLDEAVFSVNAGPGVLSRSLFDTAVARLELPRCAEPTLEGDLVAYRQLAFSAVLDQDGLQLYGRCGETPLGTLLSDGQGRLLAEPMLQPRSVASLIQTLAPGVETPLPMTREADWLARCLPPPRPVTSVAPQLASPRLRLGRSVQ